MKESDLIEWLLDGDVAIQYHVQRDLLNSDKNNFKNESPRKAGELVFFLFAKKKGIGDVDFIKPNILDKPILIWKKQEDPVAGIP